MKVLFEEIHEILILFFFYFQVSAREPLLFFNTGINIEGNSSI